MQKAGGENPKYLVELYKQAVIFRSNTITNDRKHPLCLKYEIMPSGKRYRSIKCRTARYNRSFVPTSVRILNDLKTLLSQ